MRNTVVTLVYDSNKDRFGLIRQDKWGLIQISDSSEYVPFIAFGDFEILDTWWE